MIIRCTYCKDEGGDDYICTAPPLYCSVIGWGVCERHRELFEEKTEKNSCTWIESGEMNNGMAR